MQELSSHDCPNVLELIESFEDSDCYYVVTKFMPAGDLFNFISKQEKLPLDEDLTKRIIKQVCLGVQSLHERNIVHRDVKIDNILMSSLHSKDAQLRLGDLGSAVKLQSASDTTQF